MQCECLDPWHENKPCKNTTDSVESWVPGTIASPALCMLCLFGCEQFNGVK